MTFEINDKQYEMKIGDQMGIANEDKLVQMLKSFGSEFATNETFAYALKSNGLDEEFCRIIFDDKDFPKLPLTRLIEVCYYFFSNEKHRQWTGELIRGAAMGTFMRRGDVIEVAAQKMEKLGVPISLTSQVATSEED
jgi:hypothetical protein